MFFPGKSEAKTLFQPNGGQFDGDGLSWSNRFKKTHPRLISINIYIYCISFIHICKCYKVGPEPIVMNEVM